MVCLFPFIEHCFVMYSQCLILGFSVVGIFALDKTINSYYSTIDRIAENLHIVELGVKDLIENSVKDVWPYAMQTDAEAVPPLYQRVSLQGAQR